MTKNLLVDWMNGNKTNRANMLADVQSKMANKTTATNPTTVTTPNTPIISRPTTNLNLQKAQQPVQTRLNNLNNQTLPATNNGAGTVTGIQTPTTQSRFIGFQQQPQGMSFNKLLNNEYTYIPTEETKAATLNEKEEKRYRTTSEALMDFQGDVYKNNGKMSDAQMKALYPEFADKIDVLKELQTELRPIVQTGMGVDAEQLAEYYPELLQAKNTVDVNKVKEKSALSNEQFKNLGETVDRVLKTSWKDLSTDGVKYVRDVDILKQHIEDTKKKGVLGGANDWEILTYLADNNSDLQAIMSEIKNLNLTKNDKAILGRKDTTSLLRVKAMATKLIDSFKDEKEKAGFEEIQSVIKGKETLDNDFANSTLKKISTELGVSADSLEKKLYKLYKDAQSFGAKTAKSYMSKYVPKSYWEEQLGVKLTDEEYKAIMDKAESDIVEENKQNALNYIESVNKEYENRKAANLDPDVENYVNSKSMTRSLIQGDLRSFLYKSSGEAAQNVDNLVIMGMGVVAPEAVLPAMFAESYARESQESFEELMEVQKKMGISESEAYDNATKGSMYVGLASSLVEVFLEKVLGGVETTASKGFHDLLLKDFTDKATKMITERGLTDLLKQGLTTQFKASLEEGLEEVFQQAIHNKALKKYDPDQKITEGMLESFEGGFYNWMNLLAGGGDVFSNIKSNSNNLIQSANQAAYNLGEKTRAVVDSIKSNKNTGTSIQTDNANRQTALGELKNKVTAQTDNTQTDNTQTNNTQLAENKKGIKNKERIENEKGTENEVIELKDDDTAEEKTTALKEGGLGEKVMEMLNGLDENTRERIKKNPYSVVESKNLIDEMDNNPGIDFGDYQNGRYEEVLDGVLKKIEQKESKRQNDIGKLYDKLEEVNTPVDVTELKNKVAEFQAQAEAIEDMATTAEQAQIKTLLENIQKIGDGTMDVWKVRKMADKRGKRTLSSSYDGIGLIWDIRDAIDDVIVEQNPEMKEVDKAYRKVLKEIGEIKGRLFYKNGGVRSNAVSTVKNMLNAGNRLDLNNLEKYLPGIKDELEAIRDSKFVYNAYSTGKGSRFISGIARGVFGNIGKALGFIGFGWGGLLAGAVIDAGVDKALVNLTRKALRETITKETEKSKAELERISKKIEEGKQLDAEDKARLKELGEKIEKRAEEANKTKAEQEAWDKYMEEINDNETPQTTEEEQEKNKVTKKRATKKNKVTEKNNEAKNKVTTKQQAEVKQDNDILSEETPQIAEEDTTRDIANDLEQNTTLQTTEEEQVKNKVTKKAPKKKAEKKVEVKETPKTEVKQEENQTSEHFSYKDYGEFMKKYEAAEKEINDRLDKQMDKERAEKMERFNELTKKEDKTDAEGKEMMKLAGELNNMSNRYDRLKEQEFNKKHPELVAEKQRQNEMFDRDWKAAMDKKMEEINKPFNNLRDKYLKELRDELGIADGVTLDSDFYNSLTPEQKKIADEINKEYAEKYEELRQKTASIKKIEEESKAKITKNKKNKVTNSSKVKESGLFNENEVDKGNKSEGLNPDALPLSDYREMQRLKVGGYGSQWDALAKQDIKDYISTQVANEKVGIKPDWEDNEAWDKLPEDFEDDWGAVATDIEEMYDAYEEYLDMKNGGDTFDENTLKQTLDTANDYANRQFPGKTAKEVIDQYTPQYEADLKIYNRLSEKYPGLANRKIDLTGDYGKALREFANQDNETAQDIDYQELAEMSNETAQIPTIFEEDLQESNIRNLEENETPQANEEEMNKVTKKEVNKPKNLVTSRAAESSTSNNTRYNEIRDYYQNLIDEDKQKIEKRKANPIDNNEAHIKIIEDRIKSYEDAIALGDDLVEVDAIGQQLADKINQNLKGVKWGGTKYMPVKESKYIENNDGSKVKYLTTTKGDTTQGGLIEVINPQGAKETFVVQKIGNGPREVRINGKYMGKAAAQNLLDITNGEYKSFQGEENTEDYEVEKDTSKSPKEQFIEYERSTYMEKNPYVKENISREQIEKELDKIVKWTDPITDVEYKGTNAQRIQFYVDNPQTTLEQDDTYSARRYAKTITPYGENMQFLYGIEWDYAKFLEANPDIREKTTPRPEGIRDAIEKGNEIHEKVVEEAAGQKEGTPLNPEKYIWQQPTADEGIDAVYNETKKISDFFDLNRKAREGTITEEEKQSYNTVKKDAQNALRSKLQFKSDRSKLYQDYIQNIKDANGNEKQLRSIANNLYIQKVKDDYKNNYNYPAEVTDKVPGLRTAKDNYERYLKGRDTSFSGKDPRIDYSDKDEIGAGIKRQDGKQITAEQRREIVNGVLEYAKIMGVDMKKMGEDAGVTYVHLNGKHPFLTSHAVGLFHGLFKSISIGADMESYREKGEGRNAKTETHTVPVVMSHEITHAIDSMFEWALFSEEKTRDMRRKMNAHSKLGAYWRRKEEITARMVEEYVDVMRGGEGYYTLPGYWSKEVFDAEVKPYVEQIFKEKFDGYRLSDKERDAIKLQEAPKSNNSITATDLNKVTSRK